MWLQRYRRLAFVTTFGVGFLTVAGGVVRLTGSGLGCDDWPACNDERFIDVSTGHAAIEQLNRLLSGVIGVPTLLLLVAAFLAAPRGSGLRWPAVGVFVSVVANGIVGGIAVQTDLHPMMVQSHFLLAMVAIAFGIIAIRASRSTPIPWRNMSFSDRAQQLVVALTVLTAAALVTGTIVTGTGPHAGDEDVRRLGFDISNVARLHSGTVIASIAVAALLAVLVGRRRDLASLQSPMSSWLFVGLLQGGLGYAQYFTGVPELLVGVHIFGATVMWVLTVALGIAVIDVARSPESERRNTMDTERLVV